MPHGTGIVEATMLWTSADDLIHVKLAWFPYSSDPNYHFMAVIMGIPAIQHIE